MTDIAGSLRVTATSASGALELRPWRAADAGTVIEAYGDPEISRWTTKPIANLQDARRWLDIQRRGMENGTRLSFAVCAEQAEQADRVDREDREDREDRTGLLAHVDQTGQVARVGRAGQEGRAGRAGETGQLGPQGGIVLGNISLRWTEATGPELAEVGYWVMAHARGQGVAPRAVEALSTWAFEAFASDGLRRIQLIHQVDNLASCRVAAKTGYRFERILPAEPPYPRDGHLHLREAG
ncbi:GNAT family N-acetyltransferase [Streptomyces sp. NPDC055897]